MKILVCHRADGCCCSLACCLNSKNKQMKEIFTSFAKLPPSAFFLLSSENASNFSGFHFHTIALFKLPFHWR